MGKAKKKSTQLCISDICFDSFVLGGHFAVYESNADTLKDDKKDRKRISRKKELSLSLCYCIHSILFHSVNDFGRIYRTACTFVRGSFHKFIFLRFELLTFASCFQNEIYRESFGCDLIFTIPSCGEYYSNFH